MRLAIYARQSQTKDSDLSIEDQIFRGKKKASEKGFEYVLYVDAGKSALSDNLENRPGCIQMLEDIEKGEINAVFVIEISRLSRNIQTDFIIQQILIKNKILVYSDIEGIIDYSDTEQSFIASLKTLIISKGVKDSIQKCRNVLDLRASQGKAHGGVLLPYGYTKDSNNDLIVDPEEGEIIKEIFSLSLNGHGSGKISKILNERGIFSKGRKVLKSGINLKDKVTGKYYNIPNNELRWAGNTVLTILKNRIYIGERTHKKNKYPAPPIIDAKIFNKVQDQIKLNRNKTGTVKHKYLLNGLVFCGRCGSNFKGRSRENKRDHYYQCVSKIHQRACGIRKKSCGIRSINIDSLDEIIWNQVFTSGSLTDLALNEVKKMKKPEVIISSKEKIKILRQKISKEKQAKDRYADLYAYGELKIEEYKNKVDVQNKKLEEIEREIEKLEMMLYGQSHIENEFNELSEFQSQLKTLSLNSDFETKRLIIRDFIESITIDYDDELETYSIKAIIRFKFPDGELILPEEKVFLKKNQKPDLKRWIELSVNNRAKSIYNRSRLRTFVRSKGIDYLKERMEMVGALPPTAILSPR